MKIKLEIVFKNKIGKIYFIFPIVAIIFDVMTNVM